MHADRGFLHGRLCDAKRHPKADYFGVCSNPTRSATLVKTGNADSSRLPSFGDYRRPQ